MNASKGPTKQTRRRNILLLAYIADWTDTRAGAREIWAQMSENNRLRLREAQQLARAMRADKTPCTATK